MRLFLAALIAFSAVYAADTVKAQGTWKLDVRKSDFSKNPNDPPREATLTITESGWTYIATTGSGKKTDLRYDSQGKALSGNDKISIKYEPTGNPDLSDMRVCDKDTGKETMRIVTAAVPDGKALVIYGSGITADGKQWSDSTYYKRVR